MRRLLLLAPLLLATLLLATLLLWAPPAVQADAQADADATFQHPYESGTGFVPVNDVDRAVLAELEKRGITPANPCSDEVFVRRLHVDVLGTMPDPETVLDFLVDRGEDKRTRLVDDLLERDEFATYWTLKWGDVLRIKAEFPIKLWPNGVQAYHRWIFEAVKRNMPYDEFARALLTSSGSNFRVGPVNFYRGVQDRTPAGLAGVVALTFLSARADKWPEAKQKGLAAFFSRVVYKPTAEWKEEIVILDPKPAGPLEAVFPDGKPVTIPPGTDPRTVFADWLLAEDNPYFAKAIANRVWAWLTGRGIVHEPDDIRPDNPPSNPALLECLARELVATDYDLKALFRLILTSRTYQGSPIPQGDHPDAEALFAHYIVRRLEAEVLIDALVRLNNVGESYQSIVPEPFTILPNLRRSIELRDGTITSPFLEKFGRPSRDTGLWSERSNQPTDSQRLWLLNSTDVQRRIERSPWVRRIISQNRRTPLGVIRPIYMAVLSREPTRAELALAAAYFARKGVRHDQATVDLTWALINSKEFLYRH